MFSYLINWHKVDAKNPFQRDCVERFNIVQLCKIFHRTLQEVMSLPIDFYGDVMTILNIEGEKQKQEQDRSKRKKFNSSE